MKWAWALGKILGSIHCVIPPLLEANKIRRGRRIGKRNHAPPTWPLNWLKRFHDWAPRLIGPPPSLPPSIRFVPQRQWPSTSHPAQHSSRRAFRVLRQHPGEQRRPAHRTPAVMPRRCPPLCGAAGPASIPEVLSALLRSAAWWSGTAGGCPHARPRAAERPRTFLPGSPSLVGRTGSVVGKST